MTGGEKSGGTSLLLIFSAIDLLCSALVCGIILTAVLVGASNADVSRSDLTKKGGVIVFQLWMSKDATVEAFNAKQQGQETLEKPQGRLLELFPAAERRAVFVSSAAIPVKLRVKGVVAVELIGAAPDRIAVVISCADEQQIVALRISPHLRLPFCLPSRPGLLAKAKWDAYLPPISDIIHRLETTTAVRRTASTDLDGHFEVVSDVNLTDFSGIWGVRL
jgi:hypothetical protein